MYDGLALLIKRASQQRFGGPRDCEVNQHFVYLLFCFVFFDFCCCNWCFFIFVF